MSKNRKYGLKQSTIEEIVSVISKNEKIHKAILFGSRAKGNYSQGSDIDLAIKGSSLILKDILKLSTEIDQLSLPYKTDIVIFDRIDEPALIEHIERVGKILYERN